MKLLMNMTNAKAVDNNMIVTRPMAAESDRPTALRSGITRAIKSTNVNKTATWATTLSCFRTPGWQASNNAPNTAGIKAVRDGLSEKK